MNQHLINFLSDKYEVIESLGSGSFSQVYLARHLKLNRTCAIKVTPHPFGNGQSVIKEARLLQELSHPAIPQIYDFDADDHFYYLVEEYISGESLSNYLLHQNSISQEQFYYFCNQLCDIYCYLHSCFGFPLLYQDLKPEHIMICGNQIRLLDFDALWDSSHPWNNQARGNNAFSSPEFLEGKAPTIASDIYTLGKLFLYLSDYVARPLPQNTHFILQIATKEERELRFETVELLSQKLKLEEISLQKSHLKQPHHKQIAVLGSFPGCGATHLAISLVSTVNENRGSALYLEKNSSGALLHMLPYLPTGKDESGCIIYHNFKGYPLFGPGIECILPDCSTEIFDFGSLFSLLDLEQMDLILLVISGDYLHMDQCISQVKRLISFKDKLRIVVYGRNSSSLKKLISKLHFKLYFYPNSWDCFHPSKRDQQFLHKLMM